MKAKIETLKEELKKLGLGYNGCEKLLSEMVEKFIDETGDSMKELALELDYFLNNEYEEYADSLDEEEKEYEDYYLYYSSFYKL